MAELFNQTTNKQGLIVYGGESSADYGMVIAEAPAFEHATRKQSVFQVPGRNGAVIFQQDAWEDVPRSYRVWLAKTGAENLADNVAAFEAWLNSLKGYNRLEDNFEPNVYRLAYYSGGNEVTNELTQYGETTITFTCRAERFYKDAEQPITVTNGAKINNPTRFESKPLIYLKGSGSVSLSIAGKTITATLTDYINIDCETMNAYRLPSENKNSAISGTFPKIAPGESTITLGGSIIEATITPRYFTI